MWFKASVSAALSAALLPLIIAIVYRDAMPLDALVLVLGLGMAATVLIARIDWLAYLLSILGSALLTIYLHNVVTILILLYVVFSSLVGIRTHYPIPRYSAKMLLPGILVAIITIAYSSLLLYTLSNTDIEGFRELGLSSQGAAIVYGFAALFASSIAYGYYSKQSIVPEEVVMTRRLLNTVTPREGFRIALYLASLIPSIVYHEPLYVVATLIAYVVKLFTPSSNRLRDLDILVYAIAYFMMLKILGPR